MSAARQDACPPVDVPQVKKCWTGQHTQAHSGPHAWTPSGDRGNEPHLQQDRRLGRAHVSVRTRPAAGRAAPPARPEGTRTQRLAFVFTDVEGSTRLLEKLRERYAGVLATHGRLIEQAVSRAGGEVVDTQGDAFFLAFRAAPAAVTFAADAQRALERERWPAKSRLRVRMGVHIGEATPTRGGYVGLDVHRAARIADAGHGGQVLLSAEAAQAVGQQAGGPGLRPLGEHHVKDFDRPIALHQLVIDGLQSDFPPPRSFEEPDQEPAAGLPPYLGLAHFEEGDAELFFGRETLVARLTTRLRKQPFLAVVGASGSGKSSVVRAGLIPALRRLGVSRVVLLTPTADPFAALSAALAPDGGTNERTELEQLLRFGSTALSERLGRDTVLIVDQAEELFSLCRDEAQRAAFIERVLAATEAGSYVVLTLRADFYHRLAGYPALREAVAAHQEYLGPMNAEELQRAITGPADAGDWRFATGLVELIIHDVGTEPGALPLLSHALLETWQRRRGRLLSLRGYLESGGVHGAIARSADRLMAELTPAQQDIARAIFLRLTEFGAGTPDTRRRAPLGELPGDDDAAAVLQRLAERRLVVLGANTAEVAHEALIREWPTLREWLAADREALRLHRGLTEAASEWQHAGREPSLLFRGARLAAALDWAEDHETELNALEREFLEESRLASEREAQRQRQINRRLRFLLAGAGVFLVLALAAGMLAWLEAGRAERAALETRSRELAASAIAYLDENPALSKLLALSAVNLGAATIEAVAALHQAWAVDVVVDVYHWPPADEREPALWAVIHPGGELVAASGSIWGTSDRLEVFDFAGDQLLWSTDLADDNAALGLAHFDPDGETVIAGSHWMPVPGDGGWPLPPDGLGIHVWEARSGELAALFDVGPCGAVTVAVSRTHVLALTMPAPAQDGPNCFWEDQIVTRLELVSLADGGRQLLAERVYRTQSALSADGRFAAFDEIVYDEESERDTNRSLVVALQTMENVLDIDPPSTDQMDRFVRALNADGSLLLYGDRPIEVWDVQAGKVIGSYRGHTGMSEYATFGATGATVYSTGRDATLRHWQADGAIELGVFPSLGIGVPSIAADGRVLVANFDSRSALLVNTNPRGEVNAQALCPGFTVGWSLNRVGDILGITVGNCPEPVDGDMTYFLDSRSLEVIAAHPGGVSQASVLAPDGQRWAHQRFDEVDRVFGTIVVRDVGTGEVLLELDGLCEWENLVVPTEGCNEPPEPPFGIFVNRIGWSDDGAMLAAVGRGSLFAVWDAIDGSLLYTERPDPAKRFVVDAFFTPGGGRLVVSYFGRDVELFSTATWERLAQIRTDSSFGNAAALFLIGFLDETTFVALGSVADGSAGLYFVDTATHQIDAHRSRDVVTEGQPKSAALSPDRSLVAIGTSDGFVRVFDTATGAIRHELRFRGREVQGLAFVSEEHLVVAPQRAPVQTVTLDLDELVKIASTSLVRGFTPFECDRFDFGPECPSFTDLANR
jgi:class 3 adenylate cyclase/WD40 repeat protein